jgi:hypothetical protein
MIRKEREKREQKREMICAKEDQKKRTEKQRDRNANLKGM